MHKHVVSMMQLVQVAAELVRWAQPHQQLSALPMGAILVFTMTILLSCVLVSVAIQFVLDEQQ
jgi:cytochrome b